MIFTLTCDTVTCSNEMPLRSPDSVRPDADATQAQRLEAGWTWRAGDRCLDCSTPQYLVTERGKVHTPYCSHISQAYTRPAWNLQGQSLREVAVAPSLCCKTCILVGAA